MESALYSGDLPNGSREGQGTQLFLNGYKYTGQWHNNRASGKGRLEYTDGTFYEGTFRDNKFIEGVLSFYTGAKFVGTFSDDERYRERFLEGSFIFVNGDTLKASWKNGVPCNGSLLSREGKVSKLPESEPGVFLDEEDPSRGKIIMPSSSDIYEGGVKDRQPHGRGVIYSSFPHYEEAFYRAGKLDGSYVCNYIHGGYCYEGNFKSGERTGKWRYQTVKGFFYEGEANFKSGKVTFPFLNNDHFIGEVDIQFQNVTLLNGVYYMAEQGGNFVKIPVQNIKSLHDIPELRDRKLGGADLLRRFDKTRGSSSEPILNGVQVYSYPDGSYFKGNFKYDFIYIHKKELLNCYFAANSKRSSGIRPLLTLVDTLRFLQPKRKPEVKEGLKAEARVFSVGHALGGELEGFGGRLVGEEGIWQGRFLNGKLIGPGKFTDPAGQVHLGQFLDGQLEGPATVLLANSDVVQCQFYRNLPNEKQAVLRKKNCLLYIGSVSGFKKHGFGELSYTNGYKYIGRFGLGEIDTTDGQGRIVTPEGAEFACIYTTVANRNIGILENVENGDIYVYNNVNGSLKKAQ